MLTSSEFFRKLDQIEDIPTLPTVAVNVNKLMGDPCISVGSLCNVIENDQAMVAKLLKLVNSPFYGFESRIESVKRAVMVLGFDTVRNAILTVSVIEALSNHTRLDPREFWRHAIATAVVNRRLAAETRLETPDRCFLAGLLHDMGKVIMAKSFGDIFEAIVVQEKPFYEAEQQVSPIGHARVGGYLAQRWHLPEALVDAIRYHHNPAAAKASPVLCQLVHLADAIDHSASNGFQLDSISVSPRELLDLARKGNEIFNQLQPEINDACRFFCQDV